MKALFLCALLALPTVASGEETYFGVWHLSSVKALCNLSVHSLDKAFQLSITSIGTSSVITDIFTSDVRIESFLNTRVNFSFLFDDGTESEVSGYVADQLTDGRMIIGIQPGYNMAAMRESLEMKVYMNGELLTLFPLDGGKSAIDAWLECSTKHGSN